MISMCMCFMSTYKEKASSLFYKKEEFHQQKSDIEPQFTWVLIAIGKRLSIDRKPVHTFLSTGVLQKANSDIGFNFNLSEGQKLI